MNSHNNFKIVFEMNSPPGACVGERCWERRQGLHLMKASRTFGPWEVVGILWRKVTPDDDVWAPVAGLCGKCGFDADRFIEKAGLSLWRWESFGHDVMVKSDFAI